MLNQSKNVFFLGIKGVAMANLAVILKKMGKNVTGCDIGEEFITDKLLLDDGIKWMIGFNPGKLPEKTDLIVYSAAHGGTNNPIIIEAKQKKINIISQAQLMGELMNQFENKIAVCGCHGKTTTSSLLVYALNKLNQKPSYLVGVPFFSGYQTAPGSAVYQGGDFQSEKYFVVEADEYGVNPPADKTPKFHLLDPNYIIATNIDFDHPDVYKDIEETKKAFLKFLNNKKIILCADDKNLMDVAKKLNKNRITYGFSNEADYRITESKTDETGSSFKVNNYQYKTSLFGEKNISNVAGVISFLLHLGFTQDKIRDAIEGFTGAERRFEKVYFKNNIYLFDDYAHHPAEISATINAAKSRFKKRRIIVIFQPHTFSRTSNLLKEFNESLSLADIGLILPIFASARENCSQFKVSSKDIIKNKKNLFYFKSNVQLINQLYKLVRKDDVIFTMGAGDVYKLKDQIIKVISQKSIRQLADKNLKIEKNKDLILFNTLRTHSVAEYFLEAKTREDLIEGIKFARQNNLPLFILAGGSNLAIVNDKISGLVIKNSYQELKILEDNKNDVLLSVSSGYPVSRLVYETVSKGYQGFEYHKGLPGTVGGAIYGNSKWNKPVSYFGDNLVYAYLADGRRQDKKVGRDYFQFAYDYSILQKTKEIILEAVFRLKKADPQILKERSEMAFDYRKKTQPFGVATSGCFFKNIKGRSAGQLIDRAGLKNLSLGDFYVSSTHANFIINRGKGKTKDLIKLIKIIKEKVKNKFGVKLEEEVIIV